MKDQGEPTEPSASNADGVFAAWALRVEDGEALEFDDLIRQHPQHEPALRQLHADWQHFAPILGKAVPGLMADESGLGAAPLSGTGDADSGAAPAPDGLAARFGIHAPGKGRYRFRAVIGRGGGGVVLKVWDAKLNRPLAMKVVLGRDEDRPTGQTPKLDSRTLSRFVDEARIASQLNHPGIVPVHELDADESGRAFFTMKLVKGQDLSRIFEKVRSGEDGWNTMRALTVLLRVCEAMAYAHDKGVIHRDLKPANIMVGAYGEVYVMDWGLARVLGEPDRRDLRLKAAAGGPLSVVHSLRQGERDEPNSSLVTLDGTILGTPSYMAPEQARGEVESLGPATDVYSAGAVLYELLSGAPPYRPRGARMSPHAVLAAVVQAPPARVAEGTHGASEELVAICERAMAREPRHRYASMRELASDLRAFLEGRVVAAHETGTWAETRKWVQRNKALSGTFLAALLIALGAAVALGIEGRKLEREKLRAEEKESLARDAARAADESARSERLAAYRAELSGAQAALRVGELATAQRLVAAAPEEHRGWEWGYLRALADQSAVVITLPADVIRSWFEQDGEAFTIVDESGGATTWDRATGNLLRAVTLEGGLDLSDLCLGPGVERIVAEASDDSIRMWDGRTGSQLAVLAEAEKRQDAWRSPVLSADGSRALADCDEPGVWLWDTTAIARVAQLGDGEIIESSFSPDSRLVLTVPMQGPACLWAASDGAKRFELRSPESATGGCFSADGEQLVLTTGSEATIWSTRTGAQVAVLSHESEAVDAAWFGPDGTRVVTRCGLTGALWDASTGSMFARLEGHSLEFDVEFSPDGSRFATWSGVHARSFVGGIANARNLMVDSVVRLWDTSSGKQSATLDGHAGAVNDVAFNPDGSVLLTVADDGSARLWDLGTETCRTVLSGHTLPCWQGAFSTDGTEVLTQSSDRTVRVWDVASRGPHATLTHAEAPLLGAEFSPDGQRALTTAWDGVVEAWDVLTGEMLFALGSARTSVSEYSVSGRVGDVFHIEPRTERVSPVVASFSPDGTRILTAEGVHFIVAGDTGAVSWGESSGDDPAMLWDAITGDRLHELGEAFSAVFSEDGELIATAPSEGPARVWSARTGRCATSLGVDSQGLAVFSPDSRFVLTGSDEDMAEVWDVATGEKHVVLRGLEGSAYLASFSADGEWILTTCSDVAHVWNTSTGELTATLSGHEGRILDAAFSQDGTRVVTASEDKTGRLWDAMTGRTLATLEGHTALLWTVEFSPDGARIVTGSHDRSARIWDAATGHLLLTLDEHSAALAAARFSPDGTRLLTASDDRTAIVRDSAPSSRREERWGLEAARPSADAALARALGGANSWNQVAEELRGNLATEPLVLRAALDAVSRRCESARRQTGRLDVLRAERSRVETILGLQSLPSEEEIATDLGPSGEASADPESLINTAEDLLAPEASVRDAVRALVLARQAVASLAAQTGDLPWGHWEWRETLARALHRVGRFDEALAEQRKALATAPDECKGLIQAHLSELEAGLVEWRDASGQLRRSEWMARLATLDREIAVIEGDPDVILWRATVD